MVSENHDKKGKVILIIGAIIIGIFTLLYFLLGVRSVFQILKWMLIIFFVLAILGTAFYFVWFFFFKKQKFDVTYVNKQKLLDACHKGYTGIMKGLYLSGDKGHNRVFWGKITGFARIKVLRRTLQYVEDEDGSMIPEMKYNDKTGRDEQVYIIDDEEQDVFSVTHSKTWIGKLFEEDDVVRVSPKSHDELVGDVTLFGFSLIPLSEYWFLNDDLLDVNKIDYAIKNEAWRGLMFEMLRDSKEIIDKASGLDSSHKKRIEEKSMYELPVDMGKKG